MRSAILRYLDGQENLTETPIEIVAEKRLIDFRQSKTEWLVNG